MSHKPPLTGAALDPKPGTLGAVLYGDEAGVLVDESHWVALVESVASADANAFRALYEHANRIVFTLAMRISGSRETAEEITLDVFHDVWRSAGKYDPAHGTVVAWIMNQARSRAIDRVRFERRKKRNGALPVDAGPEAGADELHAAVALDQDAAALHEALTVLTHDERRAIESAYFSGLSYSEAAEKLNHPVGTVKTRIRSGLAKLRKALDEEVRPK